MPIDPVTGLVDLRTREEILSLVNGEIDEDKVLPSFGLNYRPLEGLSLRGAFSQTVARPSFREIGYYVSVEPGTDDRTVGNPQLQLSEVESYDVRAEYVGELGDLVALSAFYKTIDDPIESIVVRNPLDFDSGSAALFRTFFNNPNQAKLWGIEVEARKSLDFFYLDLGLDFPGVEVPRLPVGRRELHVRRRRGRPDRCRDRADPGVLRSGGRRRRALRQLRAARGDSSDSPSGSRTPT